MLKLLAQDHTPGKKKTGMCAPSSETSKPGSSLCAVLLPKYDDMQLGSEPGSSDKMLWKVSGSLSAMGLLTTAGRWAFLTPLPHPG